MTERPSLADRRAIAKFRPAFESELPPGVWRLRSGSLPMHIPSRHVEGLIRALYKHGFIVSFDWPSWGSEAKRYVETREMINGADLETLQRLFTTIVRADRFCEGTVAAHVESGFVLALLKQLDRLG